MKKGLSIVVAVLASLVLPGISVARDVAVVRGGYIDTLVRRVEVMEEVAGGLVYMRFEEARPRGHGRLLLVYPDGREREVRDYFQDRSGIVIRQAEGIDKLVLVDRDGIIFGGVNFSEAEVKDLLFARSGFADVYELYDRLRSGIGDVLDSVDVAVKSISRACDLSEADKKEIFIASLTWLAGSQVSEMVEGILDAANEGGAYQDMLDDNVVEDVLEGVSLVADDGNGGGGFGDLVADDGNGGGGFGDLVKGVAVYGVSEASWVDAASIGEISGGNIIMLIK